MNMEVFDVRVSFDGANPSALFLNKSIRVTLRIRKVKAASEMTICLPQTCAISKLTLCCW